MLGYRHPMKNTNLPSWFYKEERVERMIWNLPPRAAFRCRM